jgi:hypothetical protein
VREKNQNLPQRYQQAMYEMIWNRTLQERLRRRKKTMARLRGQLYAGSKVTG